MKEDGAQTLAENEKVEQEAEENPEEFFAARAGVQLRGVSLSRAICVQDLEHG